MHEVWVRAIFNEPCFFIGEERRIIEASFFCSMEYGYLHEWLRVMVNVGKCSLHGWYETYLFYLADEAHKNHRRRHGSLGRFPHEDKAFRQYKKVNY